jgi:hypothetical protein
MPDDKPKRLFTVTVETDLVVLACDEQEAEDIAMEALDHVADDEWNVCPSPMTYLPAGWDESCIPFGEGAEEDPDRTVGKWIELGAAPEYALRNGGPEGPMQ